MMILKLFYDIKTIFFITEFKRKLQKINKQTNKNPQPCDSLYTQPCPNLGENSVQTSQGKVRQLDLTQRLSWEIFLFWNRGRETSKIGLCEEKVTKQRGGTNTS